MRGRLALVFALASGCTKTVDVVCHSQDDCSDGFRCDLDLQRCLATDAGTGDGNCAGTDSDGDDYCAEPTEGFPCCPLGGNDCDDGDKAINGGAEEIPGNDADENCDTFATDQDDDGHNALGDTSAGLPDDDCCDTDGDVFTGQTAWFYMADGESACGDWDYDCSGTEEREESLVASCSGCPGSCMGTNGWSVFPPPACGATGTLASCTSCAMCPNLTSDVAQGCH